ncbi:MAG: hypothetical protein J2P30_08255, partial [Actinobacteria bacterium]|nr:hypothetical protein [Actinomycetota bacterium]
RTGHRHSGFRLVLPFSHGVRLPDDRGTIHRGPHATGRTVIPLGKWSKAANVPGRAPTEPLSYRAGMPGVRVGQ